MRRLIALLPCLAAVMAVTASPKLRQLDISVVLAPNGDARITEMRTMDIDSEGTECYIVIINTNGSKVKDLRVTDEKGTQYTNEGEWDVDRGRRAKTGRCGIVTKKDGYELCWGLGAEGLRIYRTSYTITNLLKSYEESDGFNWMFIAKDQNPSPQFARVTITREDGEPFTDDDTNIWGFRYQGSILFEDGAIVAQTDGPMDYHDAMIVMVEVEKGIFNPTMSVDETFEDVRERAFEGSDYDDDSGSDNDLTFFEWLCVILFFVLVPVIFIITSIVHIYKRWKERRRIKKDLTWYRDIPYDGNLHKANKVMNCLRYFGTDYDHLLNAIVMRLINIGAIDVVTVTNKKGKPKQQLAIREQSEEAKKQIYLVRTVHNILWQAAGDDHILQPKELKGWVKDNTKKLEHFVDELKKQANFKEVVKDHEHVCQLYGMKKFLEDFTLANERSVTEVKLWNEYLVWATLFGIADQVSEEMKKLNPDMATLNRQMEVLNDREVVPVISSALLSSTHHVDQAIQKARSGGSGGGSSYSGGGGGGGGGFSGGGSGGGVR